MTANSISHAKQVEDARHNAVDESLTAKRDAEVARHNKATEEISIANFQESQRHNKTSETVTQTSVNESVRHNTAQERENERHNTVMEIIQSSQISENVRHNTEMERLEGQQKDINWYTASSGRIQAQAASTNAAASLINANTQRDTAEGKTAVGKANIEKIGAETEYYEVRSLNETYDSYVNEHRASVSDWYVTSELFKNFSGGLNVIGTLLK